MLKKIDIIKEGVVTNSVTLPSEEADQWLANAIAYNAFGLPERAEIDAEGNPTGNTLPAEYTVVSADWTEQNKEYQDIQAALHYLESTDWYVIRKIETGREIPSEVLAIRAEARAKVKS